MKQDIEIVRENKMKSINLIAKKLHIKDKYVENYGKYKAKIDLKIFDEYKDKKEGKLVLVSAITPTKYGEGKTTTSIGLVDGLASLGYSVIGALREPSLGPVFGIKGGACGGGYAQVVPMEDINLHFTGDMHALTTINNLISACIDNELYWGNSLNLDPSKIVFKRCIDLNDRALRTISVGDDKKNGVKRDDGFNITVASEVMATFCLASSLDEFASMLDEIVIGYTYDDKVVKVKDLNIKGSLKVLAKDAIKPNLVQTLYHNPILIHGGPFANIAHGCNSLIATKLALKLADITVTEAGFGADLGMEKFLDIKCNKANLKPSLVVLVATIRALKYHGGCKDINKKDIDSLEKGICNLKRHIDNVKKYKLPFVIAINKFDSDDKEEINYLLEYCHKNGYVVEVNESFKKGYKGAINLASSVAKLINEENDFKPLYDIKDSVKDKIENIAKNIYGAKEVLYDDKAIKSLETITKNGLDKDTCICIAKTPMSFSDDPNLLGAPTDFSFHVKDIRVSNSVKFLVVIAGSILTMPGLNKDCNAKKISMENDIIGGLF